MKYKKGSFITVPNSEELMGLNPMAQCLFMWLCFHANQDGVCFPSRKRLAELCAVSVDTIDKMTNLLAVKGLLEKTKRKKNDTKNQTNLYEILIGGVAADNGHLAADNGQGVAAHNGSELNPISLTKINESKSTAAPAYNPQDFFDNVDTQEKLAAAIAEKYQINITAVRAEIAKFIRYWTEPNKSGSKLRWEAERFFELTRRLSTWFGRASSYRAKPDKSKNIIGL